jgi:dephospho-CoA kinase
MAPVIGLTGNIASGKSTVARLLAVHGAAVIDADALARDVVRPGQPALAAIGARWPQVLNGSGALDRAALRRIVFADPQQRAALERITHPAIGAARDAAVAVARASGAPVIVYDVPLLFEASLEDTVDAIVLVDAPIAERRRRLIDDRGYSETDADAAIAAQMPAELKRGRADHVIDNDDSPATLAARVTALWPTLARTPARH